jgi:predicted DNA-binding protein
MATKKHRLTVSLSDQQYSVLSSINKNSGQPMSYLLVDMLESSLPVYEKMAITFDNLKKLTDSEKQKFVESLSRFQNDFEPIAEHLIKQTSAHLSVDLNDVKEPDFFSELANGKKPVPSSAPSTNRGVTPPAKKTTKAKAGKDSKPVLKK